MGISFHLTSEGEWAQFSKNRIVKPFCLLASEPRIEPVDSVVGWVYCVHCVYMCVYVRTVVHWHLIYLTIFKLKWINDQLSFYRKNNGTPEPLIYMEFSGPFIIIIIVFISVRVHFGGLPFEKHTYQTNRNTLVNTFYWLFYELSNELERHASPLTHSVCNRKWTTNEYWYALS